MVSPNSEELQKKKKGRSTFLQESDSKCKSWRQFESEITREFKLQFDYGRLLELI